MPAYVGESGGAGRKMFDAVMEKKRTVYIPGYWRLLAAAYRNLPDLPHEKMARWHYVLLKPFMRKAPRWKQ